MKLRIIVVFLLVLASVSLRLSGQDRNNQRSAESVRQRLEDVRERLSLTPEQVEKIRPVLMEELEKLRAVRDKYEGNGQNRRDRLKAARELRQIRSDADKKLKKLLSKKQMDELEKIREEWRQQFGDR